MADTKGKDFIKKAEDQKLRTENVKNTNVEYKNVDVPDKSNEKRTFRSVVANKVLAAVRAVKKSLLEANPTSKPTTKEIQAGIVDHIKEKVEVSKSEDTKKNNAKKPTSKGGFTL